MGSLAIRIQNVSKRYRIGSASRGLAMHEALENLVRAPFRRLASAGANGQTDHDTRILWALKDVSFDVEHGEVVGLIGHNGAGKSALLKILARVTPPTTGRIELYGRVGSMLEAGTGFHPELTGRENIYLNGAILGMKRTEISRKYDEIVAFSEVEQFLETPVKRYSSGMSVRLAFAIAAHLEPEILLIDEVLAVSDAAFQEKCLAKIREIVAQGRTILLVSHQTKIIEGLCRRVVLLRHGQVDLDGPTESVLSTYLMGGHGY